MLFTIEKVVLDLDPTQATSVIATVDLHNSYLNVLRIFRGDGMRASHEGVHIADPAILSKAENNAVHRRRRRKVTVVVDSYPRELSSVTGGIVSTASTHSAEGPFQASAASCTDSRFRRW